MMNKRNLNITNIEDLTREELRVKKRIKRQEEEIKLRVKQLPEEIITTGISKLIVSISSGGALKLVLNLVKRIGKDVFSSLIKD